MGELPRLTQGDSIKMSNFFPHFPNPQYEDSGAAFKHGICVKGYVFQCTCITHTGLVVYGHIIITKLHH